MANAGGGSLRGIADSFAEHPSSNGDRDHIGGVDIMYLKNVLLKFLDSVASGRSEQVSCSVHVCQAADTLCIRDVCRLRGAKAVHSPGPAPLSKAY